MRTTRTLGLRDVNVGVLTGRLVVTPIKSGALSILLGAGAGASTETNFMHTYGVNALIGAKLEVRTNAALRLDLINHWLANEDWKTYRQLQFGLSLYRNPSHLTKTVTVQAPAAPMMQHSDSVSAAEQAYIVCPPNANTYAITPFGQLVSISNSLMARSRVA